MYTRCLSPPPKFGDILVIWGGLDKGFYIIALNKII